MLINMDNYAGSYKCRTSMHKTQLLAKVMTDKPILELLKFSLHVGSICIAKKLILPIQ